MIPLYTILELPTAELNNNIDGFDFGVQCF